MVTNKTLNIVQGLKKMVTVSEIGRGRITTVLNDLSKDKQPYFIIRNNKPEAAILTIEDLTELLEIQENYELLQLAVERMKNFDQEKTIPMDEVMKKYGITEDEVQKGMETVEIE
ncbi:MAG: type II toxin-antitoxin system Phd/YefM family antitoxin [Clostridia bacterium]|jgi:antitoxin StbD|nr:type II toxin-antitoxin system Phd/YefM family antitoxin [Clostridia bacterium]